MSGKILQRPELAGGATVNGTEVIDSDGHIVTTNATLTGNTVLGDSSSDTLTVNAKLTGQLYCNDTGKTGPNLKMHNHLTTSETGEEFKGEFINTTGGMDGCANTWNYTPTGATGAPDNVRSVMGNMVLTAANTVTAGNLVGTYGQVINSGTLNGAAVTAFGLVGSISGAGATTLCSHIGGVDSSVGAGVVNPTTGTLSHYLASTLGTTAIDNLMYVQSSAYITNVLNFEATGGCTTEAYTGNSSFVPNNKGTFTQVGQMRIKVGSNTYYVPYGTVA